MRHILFIGTDFEQYLRLKESLNEFTCVYSVNLADGTKQFNQQRFCLIILNLALISSDNGQEALLRSFRRAGPAPIIALCNDLQYANVVRLLHTGADQILDLRIPDEILVAYIHTLINRYLLLDHLDREQHGHTDMCIGDFEINLKRRQVFLNGKEIDLTSKEFDLLLFFAQNSEQVLSESQIFENVWHINKDFHSSIAKPINRLRQKIEPDHHNPVYIRSVRGSGYLFMPRLVESCDI